MSFDLSDLSITTIGYGEPTLWAAVVLASIVGLLTGHTLGKTFGKVRDRWRRRIYGIPLSALFALLILVLTIITLEALFAHYHRGTVCTVFVTPVLFIPALLAIAIERVAWRRARLARPS